MTNLDYIKTLDADALMDILYEKSCDVCRYSNNEMCPGDCASGMKYWLNQERAEVKK